MKKILLFTMLCAIVALTSCSKDLDLATPENSSTKETRAIVEGLNIPDVNFKAYLIENFDTNGDGEISTKEAEVVTHIDCESRYITKLDGIEYFTNATSVNCRYNKIYTIDFSNNPALVLIFCTEMPTLKTITVKKGHHIRSMAIPTHTEIISVDTFDPIIYIHDAYFKAYLTANFDITGDGEISREEGLYIKQIYCNSKNIQSLDGIEYFVNLTYLDCSSNQLTALDVSKNILLEDLWCTFNKLRTIYFSSNSILRRLYCYHNQLTTLDVYKNKALSDFSCSDNQIKTLDVSSNTALMVFGCSPMPTLSTLILKEGHGFRTSVIPDHTNIIYVN